MKKISFVIPCYRSEKTIKSVVDEIRKTICGRVGYSYEIVLVNDCSPDGVYNVITELAADDVFIKGIDLAKNFGQHAALITGMRYVTGDYVVCMDDDGQTPACEVFKLIDAVDDGHDIAIAKYPDKKHNAFRNIGSKINDLMARALIGKPKDLSMMSYFCCKRFIVDEIVRYQNPYPYMSGLLLSATKNIVNVEIPHRERLEGDSGYSLIKLISLWVNGFTAFSVKPLRIATAVGAICACVGFLYGIYIMINKLIFNPDAPLGYSSLMAVQVFIGGVVMLILGMIGEYVGRIYICINNSPQSVIRSSINIGEDK